MDKERIVNLSKSRGHHSIIGARYQSWNSYTGQLFAKSGNRKEFDVVDFVFNLDDNECYSKTDEIEDMTSPRAGYFCRELDYTIFRFPKDKMRTMEIMFDTIESVLPELYKGKDSLSVPKLIIEYCEVDTLKCCYTWQLN